MQILFYFEHFQQNGKASMNGKPACLHERTILQKRDRLVAFCFMCFNAKGPKMLDHAFSLKSAPPCCLSCNLKLFTGTIVSKDAVFKLHFPFLSSIVETG